MRAVWAGLLALIAAFGQAQTGSTEQKTAPARNLTIADFALSYPLSQDWVWATDMLRNRVASNASPRGLDLLLAAVYVPKSMMSITSPFFRLLSPRQHCTDCKGYLTAFVNQSQGQKGIRIEGGPVPFSVAGRGYYRVVFEDSTGAHDR
jgi:hypothetical protein